jgi:hypothetical protein
VIEADAGAGANRIFARTDQSAAGFQAMRMIGERQLRRMEQST